VIRYPRGEGVMPEWRTPFEEIADRQRKKLKDGKDIAILFGHPGNFAAAAIRELRTEGIDPAHYDMRFAKPLDEALLHEVFSKYSKILLLKMELYRKADLEVRYLNSCCRYFNHYQSCLRQLSLSFSRRGPPGMFHCHHHDEFPGMVHPVEDFFCYIDQRISHFHCFFRGIEFRRVPVLYSVANCFALPDRQS
jgi:hypothetical protein